MIAQILSGGRIRMLGISLLFGFLTVTASDYVYAGLDKDIRFSRESGFYEKSFYLEITVGQNKDWTLYYTLDGSMPDTTSQRYTGPILMEDVSYKENVYSAREDVAEALYSYRKPDYPVDKCNVVRVAAYDREQNLISEATGVYFIGFQDKSGYDGMMRVSIITEPDNLFDEKTGIYVLGENSKQANHWENYFQRGEDWERTASVAVFDVDGTELFSQAAGIRVRGGLTRTYPQKSFNLFAREEYGGKNRFDYDLFENGIGPHKFVLTSGGNDIQLKARDYIVQTEAAKAGFQYITTKMKPCVLFLNGEYWGVYYIAEGYGEEYMEDHYGIDKDNVVIVKKTRGIDAIENGTQEDMELYEEMTEYVTTHDMKDAACFERACEMLDIDSFIDYYATEIYIGNRDWTNNNMALWRVRTAYSGNSLADGKWRYILYDTNSPVVFDDPNDDNFVWTLADDKFFASLMQNRAVWDRFWECIDYLQDEVYCIENMEHPIDQWYATMKEPIEKCNVRFYGKNAVTGEAMLSNVDRIKSFLRERPDWMQAFKNYYIEHGGIFWEDGSLLLQ